MPVEGQADWRSSCECLLDIINALETRSEWLSSDWTHRHFSALLTMIDYSSDTELHGRLGVAVSRFFFAFVEDHKDIEHGALILTARQTNL